MSLSGPGNYDYPDRQVPGDGKRDGDPYLAPAEMSIHSAKSPLRRLEDDQSSISFAWADGAINGSHNPYAMPP